jgi:hypothetical protein
MITCNSKKWTETVSETDLSVEPVKLGARHCPVKHSEVLNMFKTRLSDNSLTISKERGFLSKDNTKYMYVSDIDITGIADYTFTLGFVNFNNERKAFTPLFGERVFVCSNEMITSENKDVRTRHTTNVNDRLGGYIDTSIEHFKQFRDTRIAEIDRYKDVDFTPEKVNSVVYSMVKDRTIASTSFLSNLVTEWENPSYDDFKPRNAWSFQNAFTHILKIVTNPITKVYVADRVNAIIKTAVFN